MTDYYPIMLDINGKKCLVIGGGEVAERKVLSLLQYGAQVLVISPEVTETLYNLQKQGEIELIERPYKQGDIKNVFLVYVATNEPFVNEACLQEARRENILINVVDQPLMCDFIVPATIKKGDLSVAISTNGKSPMLSRRIREEIEGLLRNTSEEYINVLGDLRKIVLKEIKDPYTRKRIFEKIVYSDLSDSIKNNEENIRKIIFDIYEAEKQC